MMKQLRDKNKLKLHIYIIRSRKYMAWIAEQALKVHMHVDKVFNIKERGDIELFITLVPKVL